EIDQRQAVSFLSGIERHDPPFGAAAYGAGYVAERNRLMSSRKNKRPNLRKRPVHFIDGRLEHADGALINFRYFDLFVSRFGGEHGRNDEKVILNAGEEFLS